jgi:plastocyanin
MNMQILKVSNRRVVILFVIIALALANSIVSMTLSKEPQFTVSVDSSAFPIVKGGYKDVSITIKPLYGFESEVRLKVTRAPREAVVVLEKESIFVENIGEKTVNLRVNIPEKAELVGTHYIDIDLESSNVVQPIELMIGVVGVGIQRLEIKDYQFVPATVYIKKGSTVKWTNQDPVAHTVTSVNGTFDSGLLNFGRVWEMKFDKIGAYQYFCLPHPYMVGTIWVLD